MPEKPETADASRRTRMAGARTRLAWWRTGLTALAVAIGVGRLLPELDGGGVGWPYTLTGFGFALYGLVLFVYGSSHSARIDRALDEGRWVQDSPWVIQGLTIGGVALALATGLLILLG